MQGHAAVVGVGTLGQLRTVGGRWLVVGLPVAAAALIVAVVGSLPVDDGRRAGRSR